MSGKKQLGREKQCEKCPWKTSTDPHDIPHGYSEEAHCALEGTIARPGEFNIGGSLRVMACHESPVGKETECLGWLFNQLGSGNNIGLRILMSGYDLSRVELIGDQHETFEDTLPA